MRVDKSRREWIQVDGKERWRRRSRGYFSGHKEGLTGRNKGRLRAECQKASRRMKQEQRQREGRKTWGGHWRQMLHIK